MADPTTQSNNLPKASEHVAPKWELETADPTTQSNYLEIASEHVAFDWNLDFEARTLSGTASHRLKVLQRGVAEVIFDTSDLHITEVKVFENSIPRDEYKIEPKHDVMGSALRIPLPSGLQPNQEVHVSIAYKTTQSCTALQWLDKEQTQGKTFPYLLSQCQPIYARSLAPLQDTPSIKITYSASVNSVLPVLLSAIRDTPPSDGPPHGGKVIGKDAVVYTYNQPVPIPSYLIAIASGNVAYRAFTPPEGKEWESGVWAEPVMLGVAFDEFSDATTKFLSAAEEMLGPYKFGVYDLLVLPPSFPYGGMENPCISFLTPTLLTGDKSLVDVVVHELTHSWFGNGVTHAHASHFWLNEGWTTYIERVLQQQLHGPAHRGLSFIIGKKALQDALEEYEGRKKYQRLVIPFDKGENPDDAYSEVPYEKGANLIYYLEQQLGGLDKFLLYVRDYVNTYMGKSITTKQWKDHFEAYFCKHDFGDKVESLKKEWDLWFEGEGLTLPVTLQYNTTLAENAYALARRWDKSRYTEATRLPFNEGDLNGFDSNQIIVFLEHLNSDEYDPLPSGHVSRLGDVYKLSDTPNAELRLRFYQIALREPLSKAATAFATPAVKWVIGDDGTGIIKGRMKFCRPMFRAVAKVNKELAVEYFTIAKDAFHPIARDLIEKDLAKINATN